MSAFDDLESIGPQLLAKGYLARAVHGEQLTLAVVEIGPGAELPEHRHANRHATTGPLANGWNLSQLTGRTR